MRRLILICASMLFVALSGCTAKKTNQIVYKLSQIQPRYSSISFSDLLKKPAQYDSASIEIEGFYDPGFERSALLKNQNVGNLEYAIWVDFGSAHLKDSITGNLLSSTQQEFKRLAQKKIRMRGYFDQYSRGHMSQYFGTLYNIYYVKVL